LEQDLWKENVEELHRKEKIVDRFSNIVDFLVKTSLPCTWLLLGLEDKFYSSSFLTPYTSFLKLNSHSHALYLPYFSHGDDQICVQEGFFTNKFIGK